MKNNLFNRLKYFTITFIVTITLLLIGLVANAQTYYNIDAWTTNADAELWEPTIGVITEYSGSIIIEHPDIYCTVIKHSDTYNNWYDHERNATYQSWNGEIRGELETMQIELYKSYYPKNGNIFFSVKTGPNKGDILIFHVE